MTESGGDVKAMKTPMWALGATTMALVVGLAMASAPASAAPVRAPESSVDDDGNVYSFQVDSFGAGPEDDLQAVMEGLVEGSDYFLVHNGTLGGQNDADDLQGYSIDAIDGVIGSANDIMSRLEPVGPTPNTPIGEDTRQRINNTGAYPYSAVGYLYTDKDGGYRCTAFLVSTDTIVTAGHCIHSGGNGDAGGVSRGSVIFIPGRNGDGSEPFGRCTGANRLFSVTGWTEDGNATYDYGAVKLNCDIGVVTGTFGFYTQGRSAENKSYRITGYPTDKTDQESRTMWEARGDIRHDYSENWMYPIDTAGGQSGGPVWHHRAECDVPCAGAIHTYGVGGLHPTLNGGKEITLASFRNLSAWVKYPRQ